MPPISSSETENMCVAEALLLAWGPGIRKNSPYSADETVKYSVICRSIISASVHRPRHGYGPNTLAIPSRFVHCCGIHLDLGTMGAGQQPHGLTAGRRTNNVALPASTRTARPTVFRRPSLTSWGKDNLGMTRAAADVNFKELILTVQQQKVRGWRRQSESSQRKMHKPFGSIEGEEVMRRNSGLARIVSHSRSSPSGCWGVRPSSFEDSSKP